MSFRSRICISLTALLAIAANGAADNSALQKETTEINQWRAQRLASLTSENGWPTLAGLYWLQQGDNSFSRTRSNQLSGNQLILDHPAIGNRLGVFSLHNDKVSFKADAGAKVTHEDQAVTTLDLVTDADGEPTTLATGSLRIFAIQRAGNIGLRVRDVASPARTAFKGLQYFPVSMDWVIDARFEAYKPHRRMAIVNIVGMTEQLASPGALLFNRNGKQFRLETLLESPTDTELFVMFADQTSGRATYGAGRYLYVPLPVAGHATLDFNRAYNPPCAFTEFATCPLPPRQNRLQLAVTAGEKKYPGN